MSLSLCCSNCNKLHLDYLALMFLFKNHNQVTQKKHKSLMWSGSCRNYFLSTQLRIPTVSLCRSRHDKSPVLVTTGYKGNSLRWAVLTACFPLGQRSWAETAKFTNEYSPEKKSLHSFSRMSHNAFLSAVTTVSPLCTRCLSTSVLSYNSPIL